MHMARKRGVSRMRVEYKSEFKSYVVHDLSDHEVYYLGVMNTPEWVISGVAVLSLVEPETEVEGVGFFYAPGVFYLDIKSSIPIEHRRYINEQQSE